MHIVTYSCRHVYCYKASVIATHAWLPAPAPGRPGRRQLPQPLLGRFLDAATLCMAKDVVAPRPQRRPFHEISIVLYGY